MTNYDTKDPIKKVYDTHEDLNLRKGIVDAHVISAFYNHIGNDVKKLDSMKKDDVQNVLKDLYHKHGADILKKEYNLDLKSTKLHASELNQMYNMLLGANIDYISNQIVTEGSKFNLNNIAGIGQQVRSQNLENIIGHEISTFSKEDREAMIKKYFLPHLKDGKQFNYDLAHANPTQLAGATQAALAGDASKIKQMIGQYTMQEEKKKAPAKK